MFYYRITTTQREENRAAGGRIHATQTLDFREYLRRSDLADAIAFSISQRKIDRVTIEPISQADYIRATRPD